MKLRLFWGSIRSSPWISMLASGVKDFPVLKITHICASPRDLLESRKVSNLIPSLARIPGPGKADIVLIGVLCEHRGLAALHTTPAATMHSVPGRRVAQFLAPGFDGAVHEILATLSFGGTLVLRMRDDDPFSHLTQVDSALLNPSVVTHLNPIDYPNLQYVRPVSVPIFPDCVLTML